LFTWGERKTVKIFLRVGRGIGPVTTAPVLRTVFTILSADLSTTEPGLATVDVEASSIGSEFNLPKDEKFKVSNYPKVDVEAISIDPFLGGSSRQISSVSEEDRKKLLKELKKELLDEALVKLNEKLGVDQLLIDSSIEEEVLDEDFSNKVGDEATNLNLKLDLKVVGKVLSKSELLSISKSKLEDKIPSGFVLRDDQIKYTFENFDKQGEFEVNVGANLLPSIDTLEVAKKISGKYPNIAEEYLQSIAGFVEAEIKISPVLKGDLATLPHV